MYNKRSIGFDNENKASQYLKSHGYNILCQNFNCRSGEIDIIAKHNTYLVFIEVKYRKSSTMGLPAEAIDIRKIKKITRTAMYYMYKNQIPMDTPCRFDVVDILNNKITIIENAFELCE